MNSLLFIIVLISTVTFIGGQNCGVPSTPSPYTIPTNSPPFAPRNHTLRPTNIWGSIQAPYPTNSFFTNVALDDLYFPIVPYPYFVELSNNGIQISFSEWKNVQTDYITMAFTPDLILSSAENLIQTIQSFDQLSVTMNWSGQNPSQYMSSPIVKGSPYITMIYEDITPVIQSAHAFLSVNGNWGSGPFNATSFTVYMNSGMTWKIYSLGGQYIQFRKINNQLIASGPFSGVLRATIVLQDTVALDLAAETYPIGAVISYSFPEEDTAVMQYSWKLAGNCQGPLLLAALPHHLDSLVFSSSLEQTNLTFNTIKGLMVGVLGNIWTIQEQLTTIDWFSPSGIDSSKIDAINASLQNDKSRRCYLPDPYNAGKVLSSMGRLALIADELGENETAYQIRENMKADMDPWLLGTNWNALNYDISWGGLCSSFGMSDPNADYGNGWYNDHHFHYGYFFYAAAVIGKGDRGWLASRKTQLLNLVKDVANPNHNDPYFPVTRYKDWFDGHSWASGLFPFGDSKNQESTSESANAYYGLYLLGKAFQDTDLTNWGRLLLATEMRSIKKYWHIPSTSNIYPEPFASNKIVGVLWSSKVDYATFFGDNIEYIHCIHMLPFTPITEELLPSAYIQEEYNVLATAFSRNLTAEPLSDAWKGFIYMDHAIIDKQTAWEEVNTLGWYDNGNSRTNTLYWVATRP